MNTNDLEVLLNRTYSNATTMFFLSYFILKENLTTGNNSTMMKNSFLWKKGSKQFEFSFIKKKLKDFDKDILLIKSHVLFKEIQHISKEYVLITYNIPEKYYSLIYRIKNRNIYYSEKELEILKSRDNLTLSFLNWSTVMPKFLANKLAKNFMLNSTVTDELQKMFETNNMNAHFIIGDECFDCDEEDIERFKKALKSLDVSH